MSTVNKPNAVSGQTGDSDAGPRILHFSSVVEADTADQQEQTGSPPLSRLASGDNPPEQQLFLLAAGLPTDIEAEHALGNLQGSSSLQEAADITSSAASVDAQGVEIEDNSRDASAIRKCNRSLWSRAKENTLLALSDR
jgi:hypothetical protein